MTTPYSAYYGSSTSYSISPWSTTPTPYFEVQKVKKGKTPPPPSFASFIPNPVYTFHPSVVIAMRPIRETFEGVLPPAAKRALDHEIAWTRELAKIEEEALQQDQLFARSSEKTLSKIARAAKTLREASL